MNDISGRQVRMNAKIFERFTQQEIDQHLHTNGDLIALLTKGLDDYNNEQNEKSKTTEKLIETMRAPLRSVRRETKNEEVKPIVQTLVQNECRKSIRKIKNEKGDSDMVFPSLEATPQMPVKQEPPMEGYDMFAIGNTNELDVDEKPTIDIDSSDQIESVFIIEQLDSGTEYRVPAETNAGYEDEQTDCWMDDEFCNEMDGGDEIGKSEFLADVWPNNEIDTKPKASKKRKTTKKVKRKKKLPQAPSKKLPCSVCQKRVNKDKLNVHTVDSHSVLDRPFECFVCHKQFKQYRNVSSHLRNHYINERNFICHMCGDAFMLNSELRKHIFNRHNNIRPFKCEVCGKSFKHRQAVKVHMRTHTGVKAFQCSVCSESFSANSSLRLHIRRHTNEKPYECRHCGKRFSDLSTHRQHERIHTGEKPYACHLCGRTCAQAANIKSHYRHFHKMIVKHVSMTRLVTDEEMIPIM